MKVRNKILLVCCVCLLLACLALLLSRILFFRDKSDVPMEEEDLLAYLAEQEQEDGEDERQDLRWLIDLEPAE